VQLQFAALGGVRTNGNVSRFPGCGTPRPSRSGGEIGHRFVVALPTFSPGLMNIDIHLPMKSPGDSGALLSQRRGCHRIGRDRAPRCVDVQSPHRIFSAAETPCAPPSG